MEDSIWLENLQEWIFEDLKPVTYKWLSRNLKVHVNVAKQMLFEFADKNKSKVSLVYLLAGKTAENDILVKLVKDQDLSKAESKFVKLTSKHIHTITAKDESGKLLSEVNVLNVDMMARKELKPSTAYSGIINKRAVPRSPKVAIAEPAPKITKTEEKVTKEQETKLKKAKAGIEGMFEKQKSEVKPVVQPPAEKTASQTTKPTTAAAKKGGGIAGMFAKQVATGNTKKATSSQTEDKSSPSNSPGKENRLNQEREDRERKEKEEKEKKEKTEKDKKSKNEKAKKRPAAAKAKDDNPSKRRKRIQVASDSDSSEEEAQDEPVVDSPPPPQASRIDSESDDEMIPATPVDNEKLPRSKRRVRKMQKKTYVDDDGFIVTKMEMDSCSEESETEEKQEKPKTPAKPALPSSGDSGKKSTASSTASSTAGSGGKTKQASIMNFFQKK